MSRARVAVIQFPGVNCEAETVRALERVALAGEIFLWTRPASDLAAFQGYVLPGGFSWQDRVRAGALSAKVEVHGKPVLGICNGAQILVEAGLVPGGGGVELALARNRMPGRSGYLARWVCLRVEPSPCVFTRTLAPGTVLPLPVAHGEGRFTSGTPGRVAALLERGQVPLRYATVHGALATAYPDDPNGSDEAAAAVCNAAGTVLALMPHPERALELGQLGRAVGGDWAERRRLACEAGTVAGAAGPGVALFEGLRRHLEGS